MSGTQRGNPIAVIERLLSSPHSFSFFQAVRLLQLWLSKHHGVSTAHGLAEAIQFRNHLSATFPASEIASLELFDSDNAAMVLTLEEALKAQKIALTPAFMGFLGVNGTLPTVYTELFLEREIYHRDRAGRAFLDIFQHRAVSLFYQGWQKHRLELQYEFDRQQRFLPLLLSFAGVGQQALHHRLNARAGGVSDQTIAFFSGLFQRHSVAAETIQKVLSVYFAVPVTLTQFVGRWYDLPPDRRTKLGLGQATLGKDALVGERVWQRDLRVRLEFGPMKRSKFKKFLPGQPAALALREFLKLMTGGTLEYEIRLKLAASEVKGCVLGDTEAPQLGWDSFMITRRETQDRTDAGYDLLALT